MRALRSLVISGGLSFLCASAYFFPRVGFKAAYWLPTVGEQVLYPAFVAVLLLLPVTWLFVSKVSISEKPHAACVVILVGFCWIAFLGVFTAAGYSVLDIAEALTDRAEVVAARWIRIAIVVIGLSVLVILMMRLRRSWGKTLRFLAILGYLFTAVAMLRVAEHERVTSRESADEFRSTTSPTTHGQASRILPQRQVVWIIMDELDYDETLGRKPEVTRSEPLMPNLEHLSQIGISAQNAYSPARDTIASIPALLTGYAPSGIRFTPRGLNIETHEFGERLFDESNSVFARLPGGPQSAAILGFYHPYCSLFPAVSPCAALPVDNVGRWFDALTVFAQPLVSATRWLPDRDALLPEFIYQCFEPMYRISDATMRLYADFLSLREKSLVYIHVNLPHAPGDFSQRLFRSRNAGDDRTQYRRNLLLVDQLIGQAISILEARAGDQSILLIISSDHWHRINSPLQPQRVPWLAWHVGESRAASVPGRISTLNTSLLIESYLDGNFENQSQIAEWWTRQPIYPTLMPHGNSYE